MANLIRSAKSVEHQRAARVPHHLSYQFFRSGAGRSLDDLDPALLTALLSASDPRLSENTAQYLGYLDLATLAAFYRLPDYLVSALSHFSILLLFYSFPTVLLYSYRTLTLRISSGFSVVV